MTNTRIDPIVALMDELDAPLVDRRGWLADVEEEITQLEAAGICNGTVYWRDANQDGKHPKLYINHGVDEECPVHGAPDKPGGRVRKYVGTNEANQTAAKEAIARWKRHRQLLDERDGLQAALRSAAEALADFYRALGYNEPTPDAPEPQPKDSWRPHTYYRQRYRAW